MIQTRDPEAAPTVKIKKKLSLLSRIYHKILPKNLPVGRKKPDLTTENKVITNDQALLSNITTFFTKIVEDIMIPRSDIAAVSIDASLPQLCENINQHGHTRTVVYQESLDNVVGFIHIKDLFQVISNDQPFDFNQLLRKPLVVPPTTKLIDLFLQMQTNRIHIAIVVDEYGGTDGLITIEDIIEEIFGEIDDEHDIDNNEEYKIIKPGLIITSARLEISELEKIIDQHLKDEQEEIDTIGGLIMARLGSIPQRGQIIQINEQVTATILSSTPRTIKLIKLQY